MPSKFNVSHSGSVDSDLIWANVWNHTVSENVRALGQPPSYEQALLECRNAKDVIATSIKAQTAEHHSPSKADQLFLVAVAIAQTHPELVDGVPLSRSEKIPHIVINHVSTFLRYADAIDKSLECLANICFPAAVLFASVRFMLSIAVKDMNIFISMEAQFEEVNRRLCRLDVYLKIERPTEAIKSMLRKVMVDIMRFCTLASIYLKCKVPGDLKVAYGSKYVSSLLQAENSA